MPKLVVAEPALFPTRTPRLPVTPLRSGAEHRGQRVLLQIRAILPAFTRKRFERLRALLPASHSHFQARQV
jgi:hypothetical protein